MLTVSPCTDGPIRALQRIAGRLRQGAMPSPADAAWLAQSIGAYLLGQAASLDAAAGLVPTRGHERPWRSAARAERDALIRHARLVLYPGLGPCAAAAQDCRRFAPVLGHGWGNASIS